MTGEPPLRDVEEHAKWQYEKILDHVNKDRCIQCGRRFSYSVRSVGAGIRSDNSPGYCTECNWKRQYGY